MSQKELPQVNQVKQVPKSIYVNHLRIVTDSDMTREQNVFVISILTSLTESIKAYEDFLTVSDIFQTLKLKQLYAQNMHRR